MRKIGVCLIAALLMSIVLVNLSAANNAVKARMRQRLPIIKDLKLKGLVGENNKGYLEARQPGGSHSEVQAENKDRALVYGAMAKKLGVTSLLVGQRRAAQLRKMARPGEFLQNTSGQWYQK